MKWLLQWTLPGLDSYMKMLDVKPVTDKDARIVMMFVDAGSKNRYDINDVYKYLVDTVVPMESDDTSTDSSDTTNNESTEQEPLVSDESTTKE
jgi:hypothetical protein